MGKEIKAIDWRAILLAIVGLIAPFLYTEIIGWDSGFPITEGDFGEFLKWAIGWILTLLGLGAAGAAGYRLNLQGKIKRAFGESVVIGKKLIKEV